MPAHGYADRRRAWAAYGTTDKSYRESQTVLARLLEWSLSLQALETAVVTAGRRSRPSMSSPPSRPHPRPSGRSWGCKPMAKGGRWCSRPLRRHPCAWARGSSAPRSRRLSSRASPSRWGPHSAVRGAHRWRRGAATTGGGPRARGHRDPGHQACPRVSVGHRQRPAGRDSSAAPGVGTRVPGATAGGPDCSGHHGVGGPRGVAPERETASTSSRTAGVRHGL
jgi:hypothetical protein